MNRPQTASIALLPLDRRHQRRMTLAAVAQGAAVAPPVNLDLAVIQAARGQAHGRGAGRGQAGRQVDPRGRLSED